MNQVRLHGDPFGSAPDSAALRAFLRLALGSGMRVALSLDAVAARPAGPGERELALTDGVRDLRVGTSLPAAEVDLLVRASEVALAATAPVVVFAPPAALGAAVRLAGLGWPKACAVVGARDGTSADELLDRVRAEMRWAGVETPPHALGERELQSWLALPAPVGEGPLVHVGGAGGDAGTELAIAAWLAHAAPQGRPLRLVLPGASEATAADFAALLVAAAAPWSIERAPFEPAHVRDAAAILLPWRRLWSAPVLVQALASGRPVLVSRCAATAALLAPPGICLPLGGRNVPAEPGLPARFEPHPRAIAAALREAFGDAAAAAASGRRARQHVAAELTAERPCAPPAPLADPRRNRPVVVLEAPFLETSSSAELSLATAQALLQRGNVDLCLVPTTPFRHDLATLRARAPELEPLLCRTPPVADLWLSSGWPVRAARPDCRHWAVRVDWEYGALPLELTPHVTQDADTVVVHSEHVYRTLTAAGRPMRSIKVVPHGVDAAMHEAAPPEPRITAWKQGRPAVLFCGGLIWRKGFDLFLRAVLGARARGHDFVAVVKTVGHASHYGRCHLGELVRRYQATRDTAPLLLLEDELPRAALAQVYTACDLLLHPYRGEGFGLPVLEARAAGLPVIVTAGGGAEALAVGPGAVRVPAQRRDVELPGAHVATPWLLEPSADAVTDALCEALADLPARRAAARQFAANVRAAFPWSAAAEAVEQLAFAGLHARRGALPPPPLEPLVALPQAAPQRAPREPVGAGA